jgi:hypothetical protein
MAPGVTNVPKYPVVHPAPGYDLILRNLRPTDYLVVLGFGVGSFGINWFGGRFVGSLSSLNSIHSKKIPSLL